MQHDLDPDFRIDVAAEWLAQTPREERPSGPLVPLLRERFGLSPAEACVAIRAATERKFDAAAMAER